MERYFLNEKMSKSVVRACLSVRKIRELPRVISDSAKAMIILYPVWIRRMEHRK